MEDVRVFLKPYAEVTAALHSYRCRDALKLLSAPSFPEPNSGWALVQTGLAYFHLGQYAEAAAAFKRLREVEPWRLNEPALVAYSTCLWQLRDEVSLGTLAQALVEDMRLSPITMCVVGNLHSLCRDSRLALQMFSRAAAEDRSFAVAHTLRGYELLSLSQSDDAEGAFNDALRYDPRQYMALAGLGELHIRRENDERARHYYTAAMAINPLPTIANRLAFTFHRRGASVESLKKALAVYDATIERHPANLSSRHQRAVVLMRLKKFDAALADLEDVRRDGGGEEATLLMTLARCVARCGNIPRALQLLNRAMELEPRRSAAIKSYIDRLHSGKFQDDDD